MKRWKSEPKSDNSGCEKASTQEAMAQHLGLTAQAVSKWERNAATPDIGMLPELSA